MPENWCRSRSYSETVVDDDEDGADAEPEETDEDGDEQDTLQSEDDNFGGGWLRMGKLDGGSVLCPGSSNVKDRRAVSRHPVAIRRGMMERA